MKQTFQFPLQTSNGIVNIVVGQAFGPNNSLTKINHFFSSSKYITWVVAVAKSVHLSYTDIEEATRRAMALVATGAADSAVVQEVA